MREITIVLPVWDEYVRYLPGSLSSLLSQAPAPDIVVVDNCSAVTPDVPSRVQLVRAPERLTVGAARTLGLGQVRTEYVLFWDADDHMPPGTLAALRERMDADPDLVLVAAQIADGNGRPHHWPRPITRRLSGRPRLFALVNAISSLVPTVGALMRTSTVRAAGGFPDLQTGDDWVLGVAVSLRGRCAVIPRIGRIYHQHHDSVWAGRQSNEHLGEHAAAVRRQLVADPAAPRVLRSATPVVAALQTVVIRVLRPIRRRVALDQKS